MQNLSGKNNNRCHCCRDLPKIKKSRKKREPFCVDNIDTEIEKMVEDVLNSYYYAKSNKDLNFSDYENRVNSYF